MARGRVTPVSASPIPMALAMMIGLVMNSRSCERTDEPPRAIHEPLDLLADLAIPTVLLAFGMALVTQTGRPAQESRLELAVAVVFKVLVMPALAYALARWVFGATADQVAVITVLAALPAAQNLNTYAAVFGRGETLARDVTLITTLASVPVITGLAYLMEL